MNRAERFALKRAFGKLKDYGSDKCFQGEAMARLMIEDNPAFKGLDKERLERAFAEARKTIGYSAEIEEEEKEEEDGSSEVVDP